MEDKYEKFVRKLAGMDIPMAFKTCKNMFTRIIIEANELLRDAEPAPVVDGVIEDIKEITPLEIKDEEKPRGFVMEPDKKRGSDRFEKRRTHINPDPVTKPPLTQPDEDVE